MCISKVNPKQGQFYQSTAINLGLGKEKQNLSRVLVKSILHAIRDNVDLDTAIFILSSLPPHLKTEFNENWKPSKNPTSIQENFNLLSILESSLACQDFPKANLESQLRRLLADIDMESGKKLTFCFNQLYPGYQLNIAA